VIGGGAYHILDAADYTRPLLSYRIIKTSTRVIFAVHSEPVRTKKLIGASGGVRNRCQHGLSVGLHAGLPAGRARLWSRSPPLLILARTGVSRRCSRAMSVEKLACLRGEQLFGEEQPHNHKRVKKARLSPQPLHRVTGTPL